MAAEYVQGWLISGGINNDLPNAPVRPGNALPGGPPGHIDNSLPPPPGLWPPGVDIWPPVQLPPGYPMPPGSIWPPIHPPDPGYGQGHPTPPVAGHPSPGTPGHPDQDLPPTPGHPDHDLPVGPGHPGHALPSQRFLVAIVGGSAATGWKVIGWTVVDPSLSAGMPLPGGPPGGIASNPIAPGGERPSTGPVPTPPARPGGGPAPTPEPKR